MAKRLSAVFVIAALMLIVLEQSVRIYDLQGDLGSERNLNQAQEKVTTRNRTQIRLLREQVVRLGETPVTLPPLPESTPGPKGEQGPPGSPGETRVVNVPVPDRDSVPVATTISSNVTPTTRPCSLRLDPILCLRSNDNSTSQ